MTQAYDSEALARLRAPNQGQNPPSIRERILAARRQGQSALEIGTALHRAFEVDPSIRAEINKNAFAQGPWGVPTKLLGSPAWQDLRQALRADRRAQNLARLGRSVVRTPGVLWEHATPLRFL